MSKLVDLTGRKFSRLTVIKRAENTKSGRAVWLCKCDCGSMLKVRGCDLVTENTKSCGCYQKDNPSHATHRKCNTRLYRIWQRMKYRCYNPHFEQYKDYGARGITVCAEWLHSFETFYKWAIENGYTEELTIDRVDNSKGYFPINCRWTTRKEQARNRRSNHLIEYNGETHSIIEWAEITGIQSRTIEARINRSHWTIEKALTTK